MNKVWDDSELLVDAAPRVEYYPGSKRKRKQPLKKQKQAVPVEEWGKPIQRLLKGKPVDLWPISALAIALDKSMVTVRLWERLGYIPKAPFRTRVTAVDGPEGAGRRYYSQDLIEAVVEAFAERKLLGVKRVEWKDHPDLPDDIASRWREIIENL